MITEVGGMEQRIVVEVEPTIPGTKDHLITSGWTILAGLVLAILTARFVNRKGKK